jgi:hypothetical protein
MGGIMATQMECKENLGAHVACVSVSASILGVRQL